MRALWLDWSTAVDDQLWRRYFTLSRRQEGVVGRIIRRGQRDGSVADDMVAEDVARLFVGAAYAVIQMKVARDADAKVERFLASARTRRRRPRRLSGLSAAAPRSGRHRRRAH
jgi:hypothetical protein